MKHMKKTGFDFWKRPARCASRECFPKEAEPLHVLYGFMVIRSFDKRFHSALLPPMPGLQLAQRIFSERDPMHPRHVVSAGFEQPA